MTRATYPEGTKLLLVADEPQPDVVVDDAAVDAIQCARASSRAGRTVSMDRLFKLLP